jgi:hypothetical protein
MRSNTAIRGGSNSGKSSRSTRIAIVPIPVQTWSQLKKYKSVFFFFLLGRWSRRPGHHRHQQLEQRPPHGDCAGALRPRGTRLSGPGRPPGQEQELDNTRVATHQPRCQPRRQQPPLARRRRGRGRRRRRRLVRPRRSDLAPRRRFPHRPLRHHRRGRDVFRGHVRIFRNQEVRKAVALLSLLGFLFCLDASLTILASLLFLFVFLFFCILTNFIWKCLTLLKQASLTVAAAVEVDWPIGTRPPTTAPTRTGTGRISRGGATGSTSGRGGGSKRPSERIRTRKIQVGINSRFLRRYKPEMFPSRSQEEGQRLSSLDFRRFGVLAGVGAKIRADRESLLRTDRFVDERTDFPVAVERFGALQTPRGEASSFELAPF